MSRTQIEIVSHCWRYWGVEAYQISSLALFPPQDCDVVLTVFYAEEDPLAREYLDWFLEKMPSVSRAWPLPVPKLLQRAIGRNMACRQTKADIVWLADADYLFGENCLDTLAGLKLDPEKLLFYPHHNWQPSDENKPVGDRYAMAARPREFLSIDPADFDEFEKVTRAIGGLFIVPGDVARKYGYCPDSTKDHQPAVGETEFLRNYSDLRYKAQLGKIRDGGGKHQGHRIELPELYRIRQMEFGRVDTLGGSRQ